MVKTKMLLKLRKVKALKRINERHGHILNMEKENLIAEISGEPKDIDEFIDNVRPLGIIELMRTGVTALEKGRLNL